MSSRQDEKARRRAEREAAEQAAARSHARKARLRLGLGAVVAIAAIAVAALLFADNKGSDSSADQPATAREVALPPLKQANLVAAAKAAGCALKTYPDEGRTHTTAKVIYKTNPPTSGNHYPPPAADDGLYDPGNPPLLGKAVHSLEHGRIDIQYRKGAPRKTVETLNTLGSEKLGFGSPGYHVLVFENQTNMPAAVAATAWTHSLTCPKLTPAVDDAIRDFRTTYTDKGPELVP